MKEGTKVTYIGNPHKGPEKGIVKKIMDENRVSVVFSCAGNWDSYKDYTGAVCNIKDLLEDGSSIMKSKYTNTFDENRND